MIDAAIGLITSQLNQHLRGSLQAAEDVVVMSNLVEQDGNTPAHVVNRLSVFLVNIEREGVPVGSSPRLESRLSVSSVPLHLNLQVMFAANFGNYRESLKFISHTIGFFQARPVLDHHNTPDLDARLDKLALSIESLSLSELSNLWSILSGKYVPSVLYKVRLITFDSSWLKGRLPAVTRPEVATHA